MLSSLKICYNSSFLFSVKCINNKQILSILRLDAGVSHLSPGSNFSDEKAKGAFTVPLTPRFTFTV
jgi:hypothetical protein